MRLGLIGTREPREGDAFTLAAGMLINATVTRLLTFGLTELPEGERSSWHHGVLQEDISGSGSRMRGIHPPTIVAEEEGFSGIGYNLRTQRRRTARAMAARVA